MYIAWRDFLWFAIASREPNFREQFERDTGLRFSRPPKNHLEAAIDKATGYQAEEPVLVEFIEWLNINHWGADCVQEQRLPPAPSDMEKSA